MRRQEIDGETRYPLDTEQHYRSFFAMRLLGGRFLCLFGNECFDSFHIIPSFGSVVFPMVCMAYASGSNCNTGRLLGYDGIILGNKNIIIALEELGFCLVS